MNGMARLDTALRALTPILLVVAGVALVWRPALPVDAAMLAELDEQPGPSGPMATIDPAVSQAIADANIFSFSRTPPAVRYDPFAPEPGTAVQPVYEAVLTDTTTAANDDAVPQLYGTIIGPGGPLALMRLDAANPEAQLYREGDRAGGYRVEKINEQSVVLSGTRGRIMLRLKREGAGS